MMSDISIAGLDKAAVLAALYNRARPQGMGFLHYDPNPMSVEDAQTILNAREGVLYFDYLMGRVMKVDLSSDTFDPWGFDRDNGSGAAQSVIDALRATGQTLTEESQQAQKLQTHAAANIAKGAMQESHSTQVEEGMVTFRLGLSDMADTLGPIVDDILED
jgi:hypothetical protein